MTAGIVAWRDHPLFAGSVAPERSRALPVDRLRLAGARLARRNPPVARRDPGAAARRGCRRHRHGAAPRRRRPVCPGRPARGSPGSRRNCWNACPAASSGPCRSTSGATATAPDSSPGARPRTCRRSGPWSRRCGTRRWGGTRGRAERRPDGDWAKRSSPGPAVSTTTPCAAGATSAFRVAGRSDSAIFSSTYRTRPPVSEANPPRREIAAIGIGRTRPARSPAYGWIVCRTPRSRAARRRPSAPLSPAARSATVSRLNGSSTPPVALDIPVVADRCRRARSARGAADNDFLSALLENPSGGGGRPSHLNR